MFEADMDMIHAALTECDEIACISAQTLSLCMSQDCMALTVAYSQRLSHLLATIYAPT